MYPLLRYFPEVIIDLIYQYSREKTTEDYHYGSGRQANQLFYYYREGQWVGDLSHHFWTYDIWLKPLHPKIKAVEITMDFTERKANPRDICLADKSCFGICRYQISKGWGLAFHHKYKAFSIKTLEEMDIWERQRWGNFLTRLETSAYLDLWLQRQLIMKNEE